MSDVHDKQTRSYNMSRNKGKKTKPDIVLPKLRTAIFVYGCFWHGHENCRNFVVPKTLTKFWLDKIEDNKQRDLDNFSDIKNEGWKVFTIFECELKGIKQERTLNKILTRLNKLSAVN